MDSQGVPIRQNSGQIRFGKEFAESTFRKVYHALQTLHVHFQQENEYKVFQVIIFSDYNYVIDNGIIFRLILSQGNTWGTRAMTHQWWYPN